MSSDEDDVLPPRAPGPRKRRPPPDPSDEEAEGPTTFRPAPKYKPSVARASRPAVPDRGPIPAGPGWIERIVFGRVSSGQLARFCRQFAAYLDAGVDLFK